MNSEAKATKTRGPRKKVEPVPVPPGTLITLSNAQVSCALSISIRKLQAMVSAGEFPRPDFPIGDLPRWKQQTFNAWVEKQSERSKGHN